MHYDYDLFVIGAGSGGVRASRTAASFGGKVAICEDLYMGGTCVNVGCVPKKLYAYASEYKEHFRDARGFGWQVPNPEFDWATLRKNKQTEISRLNDIYNDILADTHVEIIRGKGRFIDKHTVDVGGHQYTAERIIIAVGSWPFIPSFPGSEYVLSSNDVFDLETFPKRLVIVGGGYIAIEFASIFNGLGSDVTQLYRGDLFLSGFDNDVREEAAKEIAKKGVDLRFNTDIKSIEKLSDESFKLSLTTDESLHADAVLYATGRKPNLSGLGLDNVNVTLTDEGFIKVNEHYQTSESNIYALGDVVGKKALTPVALEEGMTLARHLYNNEPCELNYQNIATTIFCQPNIGMIGMTEEKAKNRYPNLIKYRHYYRAMRHNLSGRDERSMMKLLVDGDTDKIVGMHMVGENAGEILQGFAVAMRMGATKADFDSTIGIHPTAAEEFVTMRESVED